VEKKHCTLAAASFIWREAELNGSLTMPPFVLASSLLSNDVMVSGGGGGIFCGGVLSAGKEAFDGGGRAASASWGWGSRRRRS